MPKLKKEDTLCNIVKNISNSENITLLLIVL
jgi:hypothetical protein